MRKPRPAKFENSNNQKLAKSEDLKAFLHNAKTSKICKFEYLKIQNLKNLKTGELEDLDILNSRWPNVVNLLVGAILVSQNVFPKQGPAAEVEFPEIGSAAAQCGYFTGRSQFCSANVVISLVRAISGGPMWLFHW